MRARSQQVNPTRLVVALCLAAFVVACGGEAADPETTVSSGPRVFFVEPQDGASVQSPVVFEFGIENYEISPIPPEPPETVRPGVGHHHLGVNTDCLPAGQEIPQADPWIHFGQGTSTIEMLLEPGQHTFVLQVGDDLHRTIDGLCETISVTVVE